MAGIGTLPIKKIRGYMNNEPQSDLAALREGVLLIAEAMLLMSPILASIDQSLTEIKVKLNAA